MCFYHKKRAKPQYIIGILHISYACIFCVNWCLLARMLGIHWWSIGLPFWVEREMLVNKHSRYFDASVEKLGISLVSRAWMIKGQAYLWFDIRWIEVMCMWPGTSFLFWDKIRVSRCYVRLAKNQKTGDVNTPQTYVCDRIFPPQNLELSSESCIWHNFSSRDVLSNLRQNDFRLKPPRLHLYKNGGF